MTYSGRSVRNVVFVLALAGATAGLAACGGGSKAQNTKTQQPATPAAQNSQSPASTSPPTTKAPSSGGASF
jgi:hypothetical protein